MRHFLLSFILSGTCYFVFAQPTATPAPGYHWVKTSSTSYYTGALSTIPNITGGNTNFGITDVDPTDCSTHCGGQCDGLGRYTVSLFGIGGTMAIGTASNCEQRAIVVPQWTNSKPENLITNGATSGMVYLPSSAKVSLLKSPVNLTPGCGAGSTNNVGKVFGGNGPGNTTKANITCQYDVSWSATAFGGIVNGGQSWTQTGSFTGEEPGSGNYSTELSWFNGNFGNTLTTDVDYNIPTNLISQTGGNFEIVITSSPTLSITREFGNADAFAESEPGMEGLAAFTVNYDVWEIQQIVPLQLTAFTATPLSNKTIRISWTNETEFGNSLYVIERSFDAKNWQAAGQIYPNTQIHGNQAQYQFIDANLPNAYKTVFYRLKLKENTGAIIYSRQLMVKNGKTNGFELLPTGTKNEFKLYSNYNTPHQIQVVNLNGQTLMQLRFGANQQQTISLQHLSAGIYPVIIQAGDHIEVNKIWVQ